MFDLQRFLRLAAAQWAEYRKTYTWFLGIAVMLHFVLLLILLSSKQGFMELSTEGQAAMYYSGLFLLSPIFAARYYQRMAQRQAGLLILMRPASALEKWLLAFLCVAVMFPFAYTLAFYLCDVPGWLIAKGQAQQRLAELALSAAGHPDAVRSFERYKPEYFKLFSPVGYQLWSEFLPTFLAITSFQAFAVFGSLYFRSMPFIKTIVAGFLILLAAIFLSGVFDSRPDLFFGYWKSERALSALQSILYPVAWVGVPVLLWLSSFLALREKEIAS